MKKIRIILLMALFSPISLFSQGYYDDDIYYDASKKKEHKKQQQTLPAVAREEYDSDLEELTYQEYESIPRDVDEYNRRGGIYAQKDTINSDRHDEENADVFAYTEKIERFDNPDIIRSSDDDRLKELYYAGDVNIYIGIPSPSFSVDFYTPWNSFWYNPWRVAFYTSFHDPWFYNPWRYDPWYSWGWHRPYYGWYDPFWGSGWHCYPHHHHYWGSGYYPNRYYSDNGRRPFGGRQNGLNNGNGRRPTLPRRTDSYLTNGRRPSSSSYIPTTRPTFPTNSTQTSPSNRRGTIYTNGYRGGSLTRPSTSTRPSYNNNRRNPNWNNGNSTPTIDRNNTTYRRPSFERPASGGNRGGSYRGGSSGGGRGSFGGGSRGGRR